MINYIIDNKIVIIINLIIMIIVLFNCLIIGVILYSIICIIYYCFKIFKGN